MGTTDKKQVSILIAKFIALALLIFLAYKSAIIAANSGGYAPVFLVPIFAFWLILIGIILGDALGGWFGGRFSSFLFSSGERISKPKDYSKARSLIIQNRFEEAIEEYQKILDEDSTDVTAYIELGELYYEKLKDYSAAFNCYDKVEQYAKENFDIILAINRKADIYVTEKSYSQAAKELEKIKQKFPDTKDAERTEKRIQNLKKHLSETSK